MSAGDGSERIPRTWRLLLTAVVVLFLSLLVVPRLIGLYVNWLWFGEVGYRGVWSTVLLTRLTLFAVIATILGAALFTAMWLAYRSRPAFFPGGRDR